jgi:hypothetical protein
MIAFLWVEMVEFVCNESREHFVFTTTCLSVPVEVKRAILALSSEPKFATVPKAIALAASVAKVTHVPGPPCQTELIRILRNSEQDDIAK